MTPAGEEPCSVCVGLHRARLEPSQAAALPRVFCGCCPAASRALLVRCGVGLEKSPTPRLDHAPSFLRSSRKMFSSSSATQFFSEASRRAGTSS